MRDVLGRLLRFGLVGGVATGIQYVILIVLAWPRRSVPVAHELAGSLHVPLEVFVIRKLGVPGGEELAMG